MNERTGTAAALLGAARELFARHGYRGASIRAITRKAGANLGAVTYHFGSKEALYHAVLDTSITPLRRRIVAAAEGDGSPLDRIEAVIRAFFTHLFEEPELRFLMLHQLASGLPVPEPAGRTAQANIRTLAGLIQEGQTDGSVRSGDPRLLALSVAAQPLMLNFVRPILREWSVVDPDDPVVRERIVDNAVRFVRNGLFVGPEHAFDQRGERA